MGEAGWGWRSGISLLRWTARLTGALAGGFWLFMLIGESWGKWEGLTRLKPAQGVFLGLLTLYALSMFAAWFAQRTGAVLGFLSLGVLYVLMGVERPDLLLYPLFLSFWVPVLLYILCWFFLSRRPPQVEATA